MVPEPLRAKDPPTPEMTPLFSPAASEIVSDWLPRYVEPDPPRFVM